MSVSQHQGLEVHRGWDFFIQLSCSVLRAIQRYRRYSSNNSSVKQNLEERSGQAWAGVGWEQAWNETGRREARVPEPLPSFHWTLLPEGSCPGDMVHPLAHELLSTLSSYPVTDKPSLLGTLPPFSLSQSEGIFPVLSYSPVFIWFYVVNLSVIS